MRSRRTGQIIVLTLVGIGFIVGLYQIFGTRYRSGDVYAPYSTFRTDPLGSKMLFDSLTIHPGITAIRNLRPIEHARVDHATVFLLGTTPGEEEGFPGEIDKLTGAGNRVVIAYTPVWPLPYVDGKELKRPGGPKKDATAPDKLKFRKLPFMMRAGVHYVWPHESKKPEFAAPTPTGPPRFSSLYFDQLAPEWQVHSSFRGHPSTIERSWQNGSVVLVAQSWMLSNEALSGAPDTREIAYLTGPNRRLVFDETHLGVEDSGSVAGLIRRYRLHGVIVALLLMAVLFIWQSNSPLLPYDENGPESAVVSGRSSSAGLLNLLERSVPPAKLLETCATEWLSAYGNRLSSDKRKELEEVMRPLSRASDPVRGYEEIRELLKRTIHPWTHRSTT